MNAHTTVLPSSHAARLDRLSAFPPELGIAYLSAARATLRALIDDPHLLDGVALERRSRGYTRNLLFGGTTMSAWAIVWSPASATCIHDHHCSCCFGVIRPKALR